jgi:hypothetical protein
MSRYVMIRRLRGPVFLLLIGVLALLHQMGLIEHFWHLFWPLLLIMLGVFMLAERATLAAEGGYPPMPFPGAPYSNPYPGGQPYSGAPVSGAVEAHPSAGAVQVPAPEVETADPNELHDFEKYPNGGQQ